MQMVLIWEVNIITPEKKRFIISWLKRNWSRDDDTWKCFTCWNEQYTWGKDRLVMPRLSNYPVTTRYIIIKHISLSIYPSAKPGCCIGMNKIAIGVSVVRHVAWRAPEPRHLAAAHERNISYWFEFRLEMVGWESRGSWEEDSPIAIGRIHIRGCIRPSIWSICKVRIEPPWPVLFHARDICSFHHYLHFERDRMCSMVIKQRHNLLCLFWTILFTNL